MASLSSDAASNPEEPGLLTRVLRWLSRTFGSGSEDAADIEKIINQTERVSMRLFLITTVVLVALLAVAVGLRSLNFAIWSMTGALAAAMVGGALGLLFGLPTVEAKREAIAATRPAAKPAAGVPSAAPLTPETASVATAPSYVGTTAAEGESKKEEIDIGYRDSTSLEQIADWLTKIIIGLTLTQYESWELRFQQLSSNLTEAMLGTPTSEAMCSRLISGLSGSQLVEALELQQCQASAVPGGLIIALFATAGFLISYLWMRRYFILELVIAGRQAKLMFAARREEIRSKAELIRKEATDAEAAAKEQKVIKAALVAELAEPSRWRPAIRDPEIKEIMERGLQLVAENARAKDGLLRVQKKVANEPTALDDPWRGMFGEASVDSGARLDAVISPLANDPYYFEVKLCVHAETEKRKSELIGTKVLYFLHPTFGAHPRISTFGSDGTAPLQLYAYGAFTVGALLEDGTLLEFNLATAQGVTPQFLAQ